MRKLATWLKTLCLLGTALYAGPQAVQAAEEAYTIEPFHTFPSFEASHRGFSVWRGKFDKTSGNIWVDKEKLTGRVNITIDMSSVNFGLPLMNQVARSEGWFNVAQYPNATYKSDTMTFKDGKPVSVDGKLTMMGVTKSVPLEIRTFKCGDHPFFKREVCGADVYASFNRVDFGLTKDTDLPGYDPTIKLAIQVEVIKGESLPQVALPTAPPK